MNKIKSNIIYNLTYQILVLFVPFITTPYLSRVLGVEGIGKYSYISSVAYYFFVLITLGLNNYGNRTVAKCANNTEERNRVFWSIYDMQLIIGIIVTCVYFLYALFLVDDVYKIYYLAFSPYVISAVFDINWFYYGLTEFKFTTIRSTIVKISSLILIFVFVKTERDLWKYFIIMGSSFLVSNLFLWMKIKKYTSFYRPRLQEITRHIKPNLILFIPIIAISIYRIMDKIMITNLSTIAQNGFYENADKIITMAVTVFSAIATVMMPSVSQLVVRKEHNRIIGLLRDTMEITMFLGIGMMFGLIAIANSFAPIFFGKSFIESGYLIQLLSIVIVLNGWKSVIKSQFLIPYEKDKVYVVALVLGAIINIVLNFIFIPILGARGAVVGTVVAEFVGFIIQTYALSEAIKIGVLVKDAMPFIPAGIIMFFFVHWVLNRITGILGLTMGIFLGLFIYLFVVGVIEVIFYRERLLYLLHKYVVKTKK